MPGTSDDDLGLDKRALIDRVVPAEIALKFALLVIAVLAAVRQTGFAPSPVSVNPAWSRSSASRRRVPFGVQSC